MVKHANTEMIVLKKEAYTHGYLEAGGRATWKSIRVRKEAEEERGGHGLEPLLEFSWKGMGEAG